MMKRQIRVAGYRTRANSATQVSKTGLLRRSFSRPARWVGGLILAVVTALVTSAITGIPSQLFNVPAAQDRLRSGPDVSVATEIVYLDDEGRSMATRSTRLADELQRVLGQPRAAVSPEFLRLARDAGGVNVGKLTIRVILEGHRNQQIRILGIHPVILEKTPPLAGMLFDAPPQAGEAIMRMIIDFDHPSPVVREAVPDPASGELKPGPVFFDNTTISLSDREQQVLLIRALAVHDYVAFKLQINYRLGDENKTMEVTDNSQPFRVTGYHSGSEPESLSYERAFELQGDFSLCPVANPHLFNATSLACPDGGH